MNSRTAQPPEIWPCRDRVLRFGARPAVMGIVNVTPDSFSDGGAYAEPAAAAEHALQLIEDGADIVDIGGESTRPGADPVPVEEELRRVLPVIEHVSARTEALISIDTSKSEVAAAALERGAHIVNDVSACTADPAMTACIRDVRPGVVLMHMRGTPRTMQRDIRYRDVLRDVCDYLAARVDALAAAGIARERIAVDPGIGFGKTVEHNLALLRGVPVLNTLGQPVVIGASRKSFIGRLLDRTVDQRRAGSLGAAIFAARAGARIIRVHDVKETCDMLRMVSILEQIEPMT